jgi:hypothetical protein
LRRGGRLAGSAIVATLAVLAVVVTRAVERSDAQSSSRGNVIDTSFHSRALGGPLAVAAYLPPGYRTGHKRYPSSTSSHSLQRTDSDAPTAADPRDPAGDSRVVRQLQLKVDN